MATKIRRDWDKLDPVINKLKAEGWNDTQIAKDLSIGRQTLVDHLRTRTPSIPEVHRGTPAHSSVPQAHLDSPDPVHRSTPEHTEIPEHQGTLEGHQEVMEDISQSVPDAPHIGSEGAYQGIPEHPSTPEVHPEVSLNDSSLAHSGVPARQDLAISTPMVHPGTPTAEDWEMWTIIKGTWSEVEKLLADRRALLRTPVGVPGHTQKKTYVFDVRHITLIDRYAQDHRFDLKDVIYTMCEEFFQRRGYTET